MSKPIFSSPFASPGLLSQIQLQVTQKHNFRVHHQKIRLRNGVEHVACLVPDNGFKAHRGCFTNMLHIVHRPPHKQPFIIQFSTPKNNGGTKKHTFSIAHKITQIIYFLIPCHFPLFPGKPKRQNEHSITGENSGEYYFCYGFSFSIVDSMFFVSSNM
jgi:hypothetical protein